MPSSLKRFLPFYITCVNSYGLYVTITAFLNFNGLTGIGDIAYGFVQLFCIMESGPHLLATPANTVVVHKVTDTVSCISLMRSNQSIPVCIASSITEHAWQSSENT